MSAVERRHLIKRIEDLRGSSVICFLTSLRPNVPSSIADDSVRVFFDHLLVLPARPVEKLDIFLCSNGGSGTVPWRLVSLFREFARSFNVLIPYRAYSAASLIALGADEIVMHPFAELGPIDPTVSNEFNPTEQGGRRLGISVEDVKAYVNFIKVTVGITHEDELVRAVEVLARKVHPLALGNVERFLAQSRMIAKKILRTHMSEAEEHTIDQIIENMASKLYFHGHPINRLEAKDDLKLKVTSKLSPELETAMWDLYRDFEQEFENATIFHPAGDLAALPTATTPSAPVALPPGLPPQLAPLVQQAQQQAAAAPTVEYILLHAMVESARRSSSFRTRRRYQMMQLVPGQTAIREDILEQGWSHSMAPTGATPPQQSATSPGGVSGVADPPPGL